MSGNGALLENLTDDDIAKLYVTEIFDHFPLFDETLSHIELCNSGIRYIKKNPQKLF